MENTLLAELDKRWRQTCSIVLKGEVGPLEDYQAWLSARADRVFYNKSASGRDVSFSIGEYCEGSARVSLEETDFYRKAAPLALDDLKDIDSIIRALSERFAYCGNLVLGNSKYIEKSANVSDSFYIYRSSQIGDSKYLAYTSMGRMCDHVFGTAAPGNSSFMIRCNDTFHVKRAFELWMTANSSDCYYVFALNNCSECMFSFNLRGVNRAIGNTPLPKERYFALKAALLEQMRSELERKKSLPSLTDMLAKCADHSAEARTLLKGKFIPAETGGRSIAPMEEAFCRTSEILLGTRLSGLQDRKRWLVSRIRTGERRKSVLTGREIFVADYAKYFEVPKNRTVLEDEALKMVELLPPLGNLDGLTLQNAHEYISKIAYISLDYHDGVNFNMIDCMAYAGSSNTLQCAPCVGIKDSAYNWWPRSSEHLFGCGLMFDSAFCIHCYQSVKLNRCFEVDSSRDCADCYFCHNCENVQNGIFCFNAKNLRYAVGNVEVGREKYLQAKAALLRRLVPPIEAGRDPGLDIFNLACISRKKR